MALSQLQCLDEHHVNWRVSEGKPEFFYCEDQRLAIEALISKGYEAFAEQLRKHEVRHFLSERELEWIARTAEAYRPGSENQQKPEATSPTGLSSPAPGLGEFGGEGALSLQYWPDRSDGSKAELDLGWPDAASYRGVTRVNVHTQPPADGHTHIKEVVRKSIAQAQKVIAVVMDVFTDVDIFRDLIDAAYKRKVAVYIVIDTANVASFLSMCGRANMHRGHLKNLRVRSCGGVEFFTRSAQKVHGSLSQRFLLVDGDRAISGSYSFTWSASRLDRNLITVITGQAVSTFDQEFHDLYLTSRGVSLAKVSLAEEPVPENIPIAAPAPALSAAVARKLINPKYALVTAGNHTSPASSGKNSSIKNSTSHNPVGPVPIKGRGNVEPPPLHPGLVGMERAYLIPYLPTWPEPDPPSDVIGFINVRDNARANQVHLQRSERFETSKAIRFSSPFASSTAADAETPGKSHADGDPGTVETTKQIAAPAPLSHTATQQPGQTDTPNSTEAPEKRELTSSRPHQQPTTQTDAHSRPPPQSQLTPKPDAETHTPQSPPKEAHTPTPPVPKPRTLQLLIGHDKQPGQPQVSLVRKSQLETLACSTSQSQPEEGGKAEPGDKVRQPEDEHDSGSQGDGSIDSTTVIYDQIANDHISSVSTTSEEEFYDCSQSETSNPLANGFTSGSGQGCRHVDGVTMMARFSQSMLDLRPPMEDHSALNLQLQQNSRTRPPQYRHIGQVTHR
ncbi:protein FAM83G [Aplochiton taeniatus]